MGGQVWVKNLKKNPGFIAKNGHEAPPPKRWGFSCFHVSSSSSSSSSFLSLPFSGIVFPLPLCSLTFSSLKMAPPNEVLGVFYVFFCCCLCVFFFWCSGSCFCYFFFQMFLLGLVLHSQLEVVAVKVSTFKVLQTRDLQFCAFWFGPVVSQNTTKRMVSAFFCTPRIDVILGPKGRVTMFNVVELKCWPFFDAEDGQHFNSTFVWFCGGNKIFEKNQQLDSILTLQHIYIYML